MWIGIISLFSEMFNSIINYGIVSKAIRNDLLKIQFWNPRTFTNNKHRTVDDYIYGGGPGMLMTAQPIKKAIKEAKKIENKAKVIYLSPQGRKLDYNGIKELVKNQKMILVCGRYKGIDERLINSDIDEEWSIGDYVLSGGELAAMVIIDSISRFIPGVLKNQSSLLTDSFVDGLLDCPNYTRPANLHGVKVPSVLLSGNHFKIKRWRLKNSLGYTWLKKPELLKKKHLTREQIKLLNEFKKEYLS